MYLCTHTLQGSHYPHVKTFSLIIISKELLYIDYSEIIVTLHTYDHRSLLIFQVYKYLNNQLPFQLSPYT